MQLARVAVTRWVDVVLEGGGLRLERSLLEYRALTKWLKTNWQSSALEVRRLAQSIATRELEVVDAEARARHRASLDGELAEAAHLAETVRRARLELCATLETAPEELCTALTRLAQQAEEAAMVSRAWTHFTSERTACTVVGAVALGVAPVISYALASEGGVPVRFDPLGLVDNISVLGMFGACGVALLVQWRREFWRWLHPFEQSWPVSLGLTAVVLVGSLPIIPSFRAPMALAALAACAVLFARAAWPWWAVHSTLASGANAQSPRG